MKEQELNEQVRMMSDAAEQRLGQMSQQQPAEPAQLEQAESPT